MSFSEGLLYNSRAGKIAVARRCLSSGGSVTGAQGIPEPCIIRLKVWLFRYSPQLRILLYLSGIVARHGRKLSDTVKNPGTTSPLVNDITNC